MPRLNRIYTKTGDEGTTGLGGGQRVPKDSRRVVTYGTVDELNSQIGVALATGLCERLTTELSVDPERAVRSRLGPVLAVRRPAARADPHGRGAPRREARGAHRRVQRRRRGPDELPAAGRRRGRGAAARRAHDLPPGGAGGGPPGAGRGDRRVRAPLPQPALGRPLRDGPLREPRARRRRASLAAGRLTAVSSRRGRASRTPRRRAASPVPRHRARTAFGT